MDSERILNIIVIAAIFGLVFSIWCICIFLWLGQYLIRLKSVQKRLGIVKKETEETQTMRLWRETMKEANDIVLPGKLTLDERMESLKNSAGWRSQAHMILLRVAGATILGLVIT